MSDELKGAVKDLWFVSVFLLTGFLLLFAKLFFQCSFCDSVAAFMYIYFILYSEIHCLHSTCDLHK